MEHVTRPVKVLLKRTQIYQCGKCTRGFLHYVPLNEHQKEHSVQILHEGKNSKLKPHKCEECGLKFVERSTLNIHMNVHKPFPHVCDCGIGFYQKQDLVTHWKLVHSTQPIEDTEPKSKSEFAVQPKKKRSKPLAKPRLIAKLAFPKIKLEKPIRINDKENKFPKNKDGEFECSICGQAYKDKTLFLAHINAHAGKSRYACDKCRYVYKSQAAIIVHRKTHQAVHDGIWKCDVCKKIFKSSKSLVCHMKLHTGEKQKQTLKYEGNNINKDGNYECSTCGQVYKDTTLYFAHINSHTGNSRHACEKCSYSSKSQAAILVHIKTHEPSHKEEVWECDMCRRIFKTSKSLVAHMAVHTGEKQKQMLKYKENNKNKDGDYQCSFCGQLYKDKIQMFAHINSHTGKWRYLCDECPFGSKTQAAIKVHRKTHEVGHNGIWKCDICNKVLKTYVTLILHTLVHTGEKLFKCTLCSKRFTQGGALKSHLKRHAGIYPFQCEHCNKRFVDKGGLSLHMRMHSGLKPYSCKHCGKDFSDPSAFLRHKRIHTGEKPYHCKYCPKTFSDNSAYIVHTRRHEGYTYTCHICKDQLSDRNALSSHVKRHHQTNVYECDYCGKKVGIKNYLVNHIRIVHLKAKRYQCGYCPKQYLYKHTLNKHIDVEHRTKNKKKSKMLKMKDHIAQAHCGNEDNYGCEYSCPDCSKQFKEITTLSKHRSECHDVVFCDYCGIKFEGKQKLIHHIWTKHILLSMYYSK